MHRIECRRPEICESLIRELEPFLRLRNPALVPLLDIGYDPEAGAVVLVTEPFSTYDLFSRSDGGASSRRPGRILRVMAEVSEGLAAIHGAGLIHGNVNPLNISVRPRDIHCQVRIALAGLEPAERIAWEEHIADERMLRGDPLFESPEVLVGEPAGAPGDMYSLGLVLYQCFAGHVPNLSLGPIGMMASRIRGKTPPLPEASLPSYIRKPVDDLLARLLVRDPEKRLADAPAVARELRQIASG